MNNLRSRFRLILSILLMSISFTNLQAQLDCRSVSLFKDGSAFVIKSGKINTNNSTAILEKEKPDAGFGLLWFASKKNNLFSVNSAIDTLSVLRNTHDFRGTLLGQKGNDATVYWGEKAETLSGRIIDLKKDHLEIMSQGKYVHIHIDKIQRIDFPVENPNRHEEREVRQVMELRFTDETATQDLTMMYLRKNIGWFPEYKLLINEGKTASLQFNALIVNDAEDLLNAEFNFVVGSPNFKFSHIDNPLSGKAKLQDLLQQLNIQSPNGHAILSNRAMGYAADGMAAKNEEMLPSEQVSASSKEDLYYYSLPNISSKKGSRTSFNIFSTDVPVTHLYKAVLPTNNTGHNYYQQSFSFNDDHLNDVWHAVKLVNQSKHPWTTAPVLVLKEENKEAYPVSQDLLNYTSVKDEVYVRLTLAPDVSVKDSEKEIARKSNDKREQNISYDLVTVEGTIELENFKKESIRLELQRQVTGWMKESSEKWEVTTILSPYGKVNKSNKVKWDINLNAGEKTSIRYTYDIYIRN